MSDTVFFLEEFFAPNMVTIINMSVASSYIILAKMLLRLFLRRSPKWIRTVLWLIVALRLTIPVLLQSPFSLIPAFGKVDKSYSVSQFYSLTEWETYRFLARFTCGGTTAGGNFIYVDLTVKGK